MMNWGKIKKRFAKEWLIILGLCFLTLPVAGIFSGYEKWRTHQEIKKDVETLKEVQDELKNRLERNAVVNTPHMSTNELEELATLTSENIKSLSNSERGDYWTGVAISLFFVLPIWIATIFIRITMWSIKTVSEK